jgi:hypothetical protein
MINVKRKEAEGFFHASDIETVLKKDLFVGNKEDANDGDSRPKDEATKKELHSKQPLFAKEFSNLETESTGCLIKILNDFKKISKVIGGQIGQEEGERNSLIYLKTVISRLANKPKVYSDGFGGSERFKSQFGTFK